MVWGGGDALRSGSRRRQVAVRAGRLGDRAGADLAARGADRRAGASRCARPESAAWPCSRSAPVCSGSLWASGSGGGAAQTQQPRLRPRRPLVARRLRSAEPAPAAPVLTEPRPTSRPRPAANRGRRRRLPPTDRGAAAAEHGGTARRHRRPPPALAEPRPRWSRPGPPRPRSRAASPAPSSSMRPARSNAEVRTAFAATATPAAHPLAAAPPAAPAGQRQGAEGQGVERRRRALARRHLHAQRLAAAGRRHQRAAPRHGARREDPANGK